MKTANLERQAWALQKYRAGWKYREIAQELGVSTTRASYIVASAEEQERRDAAWTSGLSVRTAVALQMSFRDRTDFLKHAVKHQGTPYRKWIQGIGVYGQEEIKEWLRKSAYCED